MSMVIASLSSALYLLWPFVAINLLHACPIDATGFYFPLRVISWTAVLLAIYQAVEKQREKPGSFLDLFVFGMAVALLMTIASYGAWDLYYTALASGVHTGWAREITLDLVLISLTALQIPMLVQFMLSHDSNFYTLLHIRSAAKLRSTSGINIWAAAAAFFLSVSLWEALFTDAWKAVHTSHTSSLLFALVGLSLTTGIYFFGLRALCSEVRKLTAPTFEKGKVLRALDRPRGQGGLYP